MSKKTNFLSAASVAALLAMTGLAVGQSAPNGGGGSGGGAAPMTGAPSGGAAQRSDGPAGGGGAMRNDSAPPTGGAMQNRETSNPGATQSDRNAQGTPPAAQKTPSTAQGKDAQPSPSTAQGREPGDSKMGQKSDSKSGTVGSAPSSSMTAEQKTKIRDSALGGNAPRVTNVNFSINVGTVVPSTVRVVEVPTTIIEIHPEWRGYRYFVVNDEIIIVEPRSLKIVAVLNI